ncbi:MAG: TIGR04002 family protein [Oscillospiraceae bacterium]|nr:TIGR04002 family protein [Oscillospiraceae bacterium]
MNKNLKLTVTAALFTAMTLILTMFPKIPIGNGYVHMGDSVIYLVACILPLPYAVFVGALGGALADALGGYVIWVIPTLVVKAAIALPFSSKNPQILTKRNTVMVFLAGLITIVGYSVAEIILFGPAGVFSGMLMGLAQPIGSGILFVIMAAALDKVGFKGRLGFRA